jgi:regulator of protease activity HflC (stomatin/prohibitin superfamily)
MAVNPAQIPEIPEGITTTAVELSLEARQAMESASDYVVDCPEMRDIAVNELQTVKSKIKAITEERLSITRPLDAAKKAVMEFFAVPLEHLDSAETTIKGAILTFDRAIEEERRKEQQRLEAEAKRRQAEIDRRAAAQADKIRKQAEEKAAAVESEAEREAILEAAEEKAEAKVDNRRHVHVPVVVAAKGEAKGVSTTRRWKVKRDADSVDVLALAKAVAAGTVPPTLLAVDFKVADQMARAMKGHFQVPGLTAVCDESISARAK